MITPPRTPGLRTAEEIRRAAQQDEHAAGPLTQQQAGRIAIAFLPALTELRRRRQERERDGVA